MKLPIIRLPIKAIRLDFKSREETEKNDPSEIYNKKTELEIKKRQDPVVVYYDGENYWLARGFQSVYASLDRHRRFIDAEVIAGTYANLVAEHERQKRQASKNVKAIGARGGA